MSKILFGGAGDLKDFTLSSFTKEVEEAQRQKREKESAFTPSYEKKGEAGEFVLGGFDFEYGGGYRRDEILKKTSDEAEKMLADARERVADIERDAFYKGFQEGQEKGRREGYGEAISLMSAFKAGLEDIHHARKQYYDKAEKEAIDLIVLITGEMVRHSVEGERAVAIDVFRKAVAELHGKQRIVARFNPQDMEFAQLTKEDLMREIGQIGQLEMKSDPEVSPGGCILETNIGQLDATVEKRLMSFHQKLRARGTE